MMPVVVHAALDERERSGRIEFRREGRAGVVIVSQRALLAVASPPRATETRLIHYAAIFCEIAVDRSRIIDGNRDIFLVTANDVMNWLRGWRPGGEARERHCLRRSCCDRSCLRSPI
jgi:hypothetical protein